MNKPLVDLRVRHERIPAQSKLETYYKRSLIAASLRLDVTKAGDKISAEGFVDAKIPFKRAWRFEGSAIWSPSNQTAPVDFEVSTEREAGSNRIREWRKEGNELKFREFENGQIRREASYALQEDLMPISSPLLLLSALQSSVSQDNESFGSLLVIGSKFAALRLDPTPPSATRNFRGAIMTVRTPLRRSDWLALPWHQAKPFDLDMSQ
ncbi:MAG: hypothetical protein AAB250_01930, partial [Bdellovibrionota bacterium]